MEKYDDRLDGYNLNEYEALANAYQAETTQNALRLNTDTPQPPLIFGENNGIEPPLNAVNNGEPTRQNANLTEVEPFTEPTPQVTYKGLNDYEANVLSDLILDLNQYYKDDFGLSVYLNEVKQIERPLLYFVNKNKMLSKLTTLLCSIYEKSRLNKDLHSLVATLIVTARAINVK